ARSVRSSTAPYRRRREILEKSQELGFKQTKGPVGLRQALLFACFLVLAVCLELVAESPDGLYQAGIRCVGFDFQAQAADIHVYLARFPALRVAPGVG